jgi:hypothetical protein
MKFDSNKYQGWLILLIRGVKNEPRDSDHK